MKIFQDGFDVAMGCACDSSSSSPSVSGAADPNDPNPAPVFEGLAIPLLFSGAGVAIGAWQGGVKGSLIGLVAGTIGGLLVREGARQFLWSARNAIPSPDLSSVSLPSSPFSPDGGTLQTTKTTFQSNQGEPRPDGTPASHEGEPGHEVFVSGRGVG